MLKGLAMKKAGYIIFLTLFVAAAFLAGVWFNQRAAVKNSHAGSRKILYYVDPMHPSYKSDKPGIAPDCGMQLEPVYADDGSATSEGLSATTPGTVNISPEKQQIIGVRISPVEKTSSTQTLRLLGRIVPDETSIYKLNAGIDGFVQEISAATTGSQVKKGQLLATFSAPNATSVIQTYILNVGAEERFTKAVEESSMEGQALPAANWNILQRIQQLQSVGISLSQIEEIKRTRKIPERIKILAPADGFVLARNVSLGQKFEKGTEWYRIADLSRVWILADVFENDAQYLRPGARVQVSLPGQRKTIFAKFTDVLPQFDPATRTLKVRLEADNPGYILRPDMFVDVQVPVSLPPTITVPVDAVLDAGLQKTVFVEREAGFFEPRTVETGWRFGDRVEIVKGLTPGERIVVSGNFLIGSESRLKAAFAGTIVAMANEQSTDAPGKMPAKGASKNVRDPVCGMDTDKGQAVAARRTSQHRNQTYYFCSDSCKRKFDSHADGYIKEVTVPSAQPKPAGTSGKAPVYPIRGGQHG
jgi:membrane fusion protein, copper/silver efflux system